MDQQEPEQAGILDLMEAAREYLQHQVDCHGATKAGLMADIDQTRAMVEHDLGIDLNDQELADRFVMFSAMLLMQLNGQYQILLPEILDSVRDWLLSHLAEMMTMTTLFLRPDLLDGVVEYGPQGSPEMN